MNFHASRGHKCQTCLHAKQRESSWYALAYYYHYWSCSSLQGWGALRRWHHLFWRLYGVASSHLRHGPSSPRARTILMTTFSSYWCQDYSPKSLYFWGKIDSFEWNWTSVARFNDTRYARTSIVFTKLILLCTCRKKGPKRDLVDESVSLHRRRPTSSLRSLWGLSNGWTASFSTPAPPRAP